MAEELNATPTIGGGRIYQRKEGGPWQFCLWVDGEGRIRKSLKTTDKTLALREAERLTLDARAAQMAGNKVLSSTIAECLAHYEQHLDDRIARGEVRSLDKARYRVRLLQRDWGSSIPHRSRQGVPLETLLWERALIRNLCHLAFH